MTEQTTPQAGKGLPCPKIIRGQETLLPEQRIYAHQFAQERIEAMFSPSAIDETEAEEHLRNAYRVAELEPPLIRWFDSPITFLQEYFVEVKVFRWNSIDENVEARMRDNVQPHLWDSLSANGWLVGKPGRMLKYSWQGMYGHIPGLGSAVQTRVRDVWDDNRARMRASVFRAIWGAVWEEERAEVRSGYKIDSIVRDSVQAYTEECAYSFYRFLHEVFEPNHLIHLARFNEMVSGYRLGSKEAWIVRKPVRLVQDNQGRFHCEDGMCLQYRDGWSLYAWHGVRVPERLILHPEQLTIEEWLLERNLEIRRVIQERLPNFVSARGTCIDVGTRGSLYTVDLPGYPERVAHYVRVQDSSTQREYYLRVPPTIQKADEAVAWTFGLHAADYQPQQET